MKTPTKIFVLLLFLLAFLTSLAWMGVRHLAEILHEFDHVAQVDLVLMETATTLNDLQLKKEIIFAKLSSSSEELAFGGTNAARQQYLQDYIEGLGEEFDHCMQLAGGQMGRLNGLSGVPADLRDSFEGVRQLTDKYDQAVQDIFKSVEAGGYQLSLDDLDRINSRQIVLSSQNQVIVSRVWQMVHGSIKRSERWHAQAKAIFWFSILLTVVLVLLVFAFKENLDQLARQKKDLEKLNVELDRFVHTVSHDILGPLTTIVGYAAFLESQYAKQLDDRGRDCISGVRKGAMRMNVLIKDMLELTRVTRVKNPYTRVSIKDIIDTACANCDFVIRESSAVIEYAQKMPEIVCDRIKTTAAFSNLISNAIKFAKPQQRPVIKISWNETPKEYIFYVKDNGIGIDPTHHKEVFDIFKRLEPSGPANGSGIGLSIVKAAVEDQGGVVSLESVAGQGATFVFTIPKGLFLAKPLY